MSGPELSLCAAALDAIDAAIAVYDAGDRLVAFNERYAELQSALGGEVALGVSWEDLVRAKLRSGAIREAVGREEAWLHDRRRRRGAYSAVLRLADGTTYRMSERRMANGGLTVVWTDVTEIVRPEQGPGNGAQWVGREPPSAFSDSPRLDAGSAEREELTEKARRWRERAATADAMERRLYLRLAREYEGLLR